MLYATICPQCQGLRNYPQPVHVWASVLCLMPCPLCEGKGWVGILALDPNSNTLPLNMVPPSDTRLPEFPERSIIDESRSLPCLPRVRQSSFC